MKKTKTEDVILTQKIDMKREPKKGKELWDSSFQLRLENDYIIHYPICIRQDGHQKRYYRKHKGSNQDVKLKGCRAYLLPQTSEIHLYVVKIKKKKEATECWQKILDIQKCRRISMYLCKILKEMGIQDHLSCLLRNVYAG